MACKLQPQQPDCPVVIPHRIDGRYRLEEPLGSGSFTTVYKAINIINRHIYTIKLEPVSHGKSSSLKQESHILKQLHKGTAVSIPRIHWFGRESNFDVLVLDLLGPSLQHLHVGDQLLSHLQYIHFHDYIHGDIQPFNILIGIDPSLTVFLINFGLSKPYHHLTTGKHLPFCWKCGLVGMPVFTSINSHLGGKISCRNELESLIYILIYLLSGLLLWLSLKPCKKPKLSAVLKLKQMTAVEQLCSKHNFPELAKMLLYT
ncbi:Protein kinase-like domain containing protein [Tylopilus felleus]